MDADDTLVMESTTDSPEQIAAGLEPPVDAGTETADDQAAAADAPAETPAPVVTAPVTPAAETPAPAPTTTETSLGAKGTAPRVARPQRKSADAAAAAARRKAEADAEVLRTENQALRDRLAALAAGHTPPATAATAPTETGAETATTDEPTVIAASAIPDTHPDIVQAMSAIEAVGPKPKQADFADYDEFEEAKDAWIEKRAAAKARVEFVREDVARRETARAVEANRAEATIRQGFAESVTAAKARHADYDTAMQTARDSGLRVSVPVGQTVQTSTIGGELSYYLATHPEEVARLNGLPAHLAIKEVGRLEIKLEAALEGETPAPAPAAAAPTRPAARVTRAPEPQRHTVGDLPSHVTSKDLNDPTLTLAEYNRIRDAQDRASGRRLH